MAICKICGKPMETGVVVHKECLPRWIPVTEKLPPIGANVLIYSKEGHRAEGEYRGGDDWVQYRWSCHVKAIYWMPLPEPPEVE